jgi:hypothetical protein
VQSTQDLIGRRLDVYLATLESTAAMMAVVDTVTAEQFHSYAARLTSRPLPRDPGDRLEPSANGGIPPPTRTGESG